MKAVLYTDGGSRGNPGPAAAGGVLRNQQNETLSEFREYLGIKTNNEAEYIALIRGLEEAYSHKVTSLECFLDSELIVRQLNGAYRIKQTHLQELAAQVQERVKKIGHVTYTHVRREKNKEADALVNEALDQHEND